MATAPPGAHGQRVSAVILGRRYTACILNTTLQIHHFTAARVQRGSACEVACTAECKSFHAGCVSSRSTDVLAAVAKPLGPRPQIELGCGTLVMLANELKKSQLRRSCVHR
jgi:hypothetical protein